MTNMCNKPCELSTIHGILHLSKLIDEIVSQLFNQWSREVGADRNYIAGATALSIHPCLLLQQHRTLLMYSVSHQSAVIPWRSSRGRCGGGGYYQLYVQSERPSTREHKASSFRIQDFLKLCRGEKVPIRVRGREGSLLELTGTMVPLQWNCGYTVS